MFYHHGQIKVETRPCIFIGIITVDIFFVRQTTFHFMGSCLKYQFRANVKEKYFKAFF